MVVFPNQTLYAPQLLRGKMQRISCCVSNSCYVKVPVWCHLEPRHQTVPSTGHGSAESHGCTFSSDLLTSPCGTEALPSDWKNRKKTNWHKKYSLSILFHDYDLKKISSARFRITAVLNVHSCCTVERHPKRGVAVRETLQAARFLHTIWHSGLRPLHLWPTCRRSPQASLSLAYSQSAWRATGPRHGKTTEPWRQTGPWGFDWHTEQRRMTLSYD